MKLFIMIISIVDLYQYRISIKDQPVSWHVYIHIDDIGVRPDLFFVKGLIAMLNV